MSTDAPNTLPASCVIPPEQEAGAGRSDRPERPAEFFARDGKVFRAGGRDGLGFYTAPDTCRALLKVFRRDVLACDWWSVGAADLHQKLADAMREAGISQDQ